jgi:hypothetical protein
LYYYDVRTIFADIAFHVFQILRTNDIAIQNNRYGAILTQLPVLIASKWNLPLDTIIKVYSISFIAVYFAYFCIIHFVFKNEKYAVLYILCMLLFTSHTFFWIQSELPQGLYFMLFLFAFYDTYKAVFFTKLIYVFLWLVGLVGLCLFHPIIILPFIYVLLFYLLKNTLDKGFAKSIMLSAGIVFILLFCKSVFFSTSGYEASALGGLRNFITLFPDYFTLPSNKIFLANCLRLYYWIPIILILTLYHYYSKKQLRKIFFVACFFLGYLLLVNVCYYKDAPAFYIENLYLPLHVILLVPFVLDVLPGYKPKLQIIIVCTVCITGIVRIFTVSDVYTDRLNWMRNYLAANGHKKIFIEDTVVPMDTLITAWGTPYEFWLLSTAESGKSASIYVVEDSIQNFFHLLPENKVAFFTFDRLYYSDLNDGRYFNFTDTSRYVIITAD